MKLVSTLKDFFTMPVADEVDTVTARTVGRLVSPQYPVRELDPLLIWSAAALLIMGLVMVYSATIVDAEERYHLAGHHYLVRHALFLAIGGVAGGLAFQVRMAVWQRFAPALFLLGVLLLLLVLIIGHKVNGAQRWISLGVVNLQPSEFMKLFVAIYAADYTVRKLRDMKSLVHGFLPMMGAILVVGGLLLAEPDFGAFVLIALIAFGVLFMGGLNIRLLVLLGVLVMIGFVLMIKFSGYRSARIDAYMDPWTHRFGDAYQPIHSMMAFARGEWFGVGLGGGLEKLGWLPEPHTDYLLAVIAEELGLAGVFVVIMLFAFVIQRAFVIGREAIRLERYFSGLVAQGIGLWIGAQALISMGMSMNLLPPKGFTLPLMSYGGSGLVANCLALGILLRVDWEVRQLKCGGGA
ncbi:putative lipid II flippase FtsW [Betaproteobacteria bacterium]|nr:putative lipid II flippase FtsW [Betaproteobacteria bacterium]GHT92572.1 putative lipid II flippase FtsW [Betaproteobacteria bacterium]GHU00740.1 putative lipid II flippase FtsW [Betaproteobacteria bacterium]GHU17612.1 putative lipid II flippase FtsW [Betaproteobacteria bacterium]GHU28157.1 putative lipid II flippase FtsW [Betaproteobacteria bacterium]